MPRYRTAYPPEFRRQMVDLVRSGRTPEELAREFEPTAQSISTWVKQAERDAGKRTDGPTSADRESWLAFAVRTIACVRSATSWQRRQPGSRGRARRARTGLPVHERAPGHVSHSYNGPRPEGFGLGLLRLAEPTSFGSGDRRRRADAPHPHSPRWIAWNLWRAARSWPKLKADGLSVGRKRIARLMRAAGIAGVSRRRSAPITTRQATDHHPASDLVRRNFMAERPNELWVADITFLPTLAGFLYLAVVLDAWSRRIVGWAFSADLKTRVVLDALDMALVARKPDNVVHHSDRGSQYTSVAFGNRCKEAGVRPSTGSVGDAYDNAMCESFFATLECELIDRRRFRSHSEARMAVFQFIEGFYNPSRRHSALGYLSPIEYERKNDGLGKPA